MLVVSITVNQEFVSKGNTLLNDLWDEVYALDHAPVCIISECIDHVLVYDKAKTYKYILLTQLLGKAVDESVNNRFDGTACSAFRRIDSRRGTSAALPLRRR